MPPCPVGIPPYRYQTAGHGLRPCNPLYQGTPSAWGRSAHRNGRPERLLSSSCEDRSIKGGFSLPPHRRKKKNPGTGGLCRSLPPANAPGLNPYIVEFGHSTTHRGDSRILGPQNLFQESLHNFFAARIGSFRCGRLLQGGNLYILFRISTTYTGDLAPNYLFFCHCERPQTVAI